MRMLDSGKWYLIYFCTGCKTRQMLFPDLSNGTSKISAIYRVTCVACEHEDSYDSATIERYQHPVDAAPTRL